MIAFLAKAVATCGFLSYLPARLVRSSRRYTGAGLVGTAAGLLSWRYWAPVDPGKQILAIAAGIAVSVVLCDIAEEAFGTEDDTRIVLDEWIGYWVTMGLLPRTMAALVAGFVLFRVFDVLKPPGVRESGSLPGGWGVVMDDVLAGVLANLCMRGLLFIHAF